MDFMQSLLQLSHSSYFCFNSKPLTLTNNLKRGSIKVKATGPNIEITEPSNVIPAIILKQSKKIPLSESEENTLKKATWLQVFESTVVNAKAYKKNRKVLSEGK